MGHKPQKEKKIGQAQKLNLGLCIDFFVKPNSTVPMTSIKTHVTISYNIIICLFVPL